MTCNGCRAQVEKLLKEVSGVRSAAVYLENEEAIVEVDEAISLERFKSALPEKYIMTAQSTKTMAENHGMSALDERVSKGKQLLPLFVIFGYIVGASVLLHIQSWDWKEVMLDFMGLFYIVFGFFKGLDWKGFSASFSMYDPLAKAVPVYGCLYPAIETALGILFLMRLEIPIALMLTIVILGITTIGVVRTLLNKKTIQCACLGTVLKLPMTEATFIENAIMILMAIGMLLGYIV
ncbi:MAG: copper chaperone CopZ [Flavobacteriales bacterium]|jgi:copper chaperone CopZ